MRGTPHGQAFVGRARDLAELRRALDEGAAGRGGLTLLTGPAGIGKTTLLRHALDDGAPGAALVVRGAAWDAGGAPPYWIWVQALRGLAEALGEETLAAAVPPDAGAVRRLAGGLLGDAGAVPSPPGEDERFALFDGIARTLRRIAAAQPVVLVLEDLHAADTDALLLLGFVAAAIADSSLVVLGSLRDDEAFADEERAAVVRRLRDTARVLALDGLDETDVAALLSGAGHEGADRAMARRIHAVTDGNPLFVGECLRVIDNHVPTDGPATMALPDGVRDAVRRRLDGTPPDIRRVLDAAAVVGREFRLAMLATVLGDDEATLLAALDQAAAQNVVRPVPGRPGRYAFSHAVVREVLHADLGPGARLALHRRVAEALEAAGADDQLAAAAHHWFEAADGPKAVAYGRRAGDQACELLAFEQAEEHFTTALQAHAGLRRDDVERCDLLWRLGDAQTRAGHLAAARRSLDEAFALAHRLGDGERAGRIALAASPWGLSVSVADEPLIAMLTTALAAGEHPPALRARLLAALAVARYWSAPQAERVAQAEEAIALARESGDRRALARVLADAHIATWDPDSPERSMPWAAEIEAIEATARDAELTLYARTWRISLLIELGDMTRADQEIAAFERHARRSAQPRAMRYALRHRGLRAIVEGEGEEVERLLGEIATAADLREGSTEAMLLAGQAFALRWSQGRLGELEPAVREFADGFPAMPAWRCALAAVHAQEGREAPMRREYERLAATGFASLTRDNLWLVALTLLTDVAEALRDAAGAAAIAALLAPYAGRNAMIADGATFGPIDRCLGRLALVTGDPEAALAHLAAAREQAEAMGARSITAHLLADEARARLARGAPGDAQHAATLLARAGAEAEALDLRGLTALVARTVLPAPPRATPGAPATPAHREASLERRGDVWSVAFGGPPFLVRDSKGLRHLARLLAAPEVEFHALDLVAGPAPRGGPGTTGGAAAAAGLHADGGAGGVALDAQAKAAYRARLVELEAEIEEAGAFNDPVRRERAEDERAALARELAAAVGLGGRDRVSGSDAERARVNVTRALRTAVSRLAEHDPALGRHLEAGLSTGTFCVYRPEPGVATWTVHA